MYFWNKTLHVSDSSSVYHQEFFEKLVHQVGFIIRTTWPIWRSGDRASW